MKKLLAILCITILTAITAPSYAECYCACINNKITKVCENDWDANYVYCSGAYCSGYRADILDDNAINSVNFSRISQNVSILENINNENHPAELFSHQLSQVEFNGL